MSTQIPPPQFTQPVEYNPNSVQQQNYQYQQGYQQDYQQQQNQQQQNQSYYQQPAPPQYGNEKNDKYQDDKPSVPNPQGSTFEEVFEVQKPKWNDWPFTLFFVGVCIGFIVVAVITLRAYSHSYDQTGSSFYDSNSFTLNTNTVLLFVFATIISVVIALLALVFARTHPRLFIKLSIIVNVFMGLATAIVYLALRYWSAGIVFLVFTVISAWCYWSMRSRIPFSAEVLTTVIDVMKHYKSTVMVSLLGALFSGAFSVLFSIVLVSTYIKYDPATNNQGCDVSGGGCSNATLIGVLFYVFFAGYYITEVTRNVIHVTISGVYGTWYYLSKSDQGEPRWPASGAFKRAMTYSFGSICFGSLIVTFVDLLKQGVAILRSNAAAAGETCAVIGLFILDIFVGIIDWLVRFFNQYAYSYIALYGVSYIRAAKSTWHLMRQKGVDAMVNHCLIGTALGFYALFNAYITAFFTYLYLRFTKPAYNEDGNYYAPLIAFSFVIALQVSNIITQPLKSGSSTFFIALAKDPEIYQQSYPHRFEAIAATYPQVFDKLRGTEQA